MMIKIGIVGPEESKWTKEQMPKAKIVINSILNIANNRHGLVGHEYRWTAMGFPSWFNAKPIPKDTEIIVVSGHCPISICDSCGKKSFSAIDDPLEGYVACEFCGQKRKRRAGGVDIWSEIIAKELGVKTEIHAPEVNQWNDGVEPDEKPDGTILGYTLKGFRSRNIDIAKSCDVLYCIVPRIDRKLVCDVGAGGWYRESYCKHCGVYGHPSNGGCYTKKKAVEFGKETHLVVIE